MNSSTLRYAYHLDRDYFLPFMHLYQPLYGVFIIPLHFVSFYLLLVHTEPWSKQIKTGYLLTQTLMFSHDVWTCFFFRAYAFLPNPIVICTGFACEWIGPHPALAVEHLFMIHSIAVFQTLLMMQQQVLTLSSSYSLPKWCKMGFAIFVYIGLWANGIVSVIMSGDVPDAPTIIERQQLSWISSLEDSYLMILGEVGNCGPYRYGKFQRNTIKYSFVQEVYVIIVSIVFMIPIRYFLIGSSIRLSLPTSTVTSRAMQMKTRYILVLLKQTSILSVFYVYPLLLTAIAFRFQLDFLPDHLLALMRFGGVMTYMFQSVPQFYVLITANKTFQRVLVAKLRFWSISNSPTSNQMSITIALPVK